MKYLFEDIASEMYKQIREDFPDMTFAHFKEIVKGPWIMLRESMESEEYVPVRLHFFGLFSVTRGALNKGHRMLAHEKIGKKLSEEHRESIKKKLNNIEKYLDAKENKK